MDAGKLIYGRLSGDGTISGYLGSRIFPAFIPEGTAFPAMSYAFEQQLPSNTKDGPSTVDNLSLSLVVYHDDYAEAQAIAERSRTLLDYFSGTEDGVAVDRIAFSNQSDDSFVSGFQFVVLAQSYNVRLLRSPGAVAGGTLPSTYTRYEQQFTGVVGNAVTITENSGILPSNSALVDVYLNGVHTTEWIKSGSVITLSFTVSPDDHVVVKFWA